MEKHIRGIINEPNFIAIHQQLGDIYQAFEGQFFERDLGWIVSNIIKAADEYNGGVIDFTGVFAKNTTSPGNC